MKHVPLLFLDLDGTVRHGLDQLGRFVNTPEDVVIFPEALDRMAAWKDGPRGGRIVGVSNQGGIGMGFVTEREVKDTMDRTMELCHGLFDTIVWCRHHPESPLAWNRRCWCRKPAPGLLIMSATALSLEHNEFYPIEHMLMVGDRMEDRMCAHAACVDFQEAQGWRNGR